MSSHDLDTRTKILTATWDLMEKNGGKNVHISHIAKASGISRQAVYLHFASRTELMTATIEYVDEVKGLNRSLEDLQTVTDSVELLEKVILVWGNYIPEIYGLAKAFLNTRDTDEAAAAAWDNCMQCLMDACQATVSLLQKQGQLAAVWTVPVAAETLFMLFSVQNWEQLTVEFGWSQQAYLDNMTMVAKRLLRDA